MSNTTDKKFNVESLLAQFDIIEKSITRAKLPFQMGMLQKPVIDVTLYELIKSWHQMENLIREISPEQFGYKEVKSTYRPKITAEALDLCPFCGDPNCQSDHK